MHNTQHTIQSSRTFLLQLLEIVESNNFFWDEPLINVSEDLEVVLEWYHKSRKITIYIKDNSVDYIKVWGADTDSEMEDGKIETAEDIKCLWRWISQA